MTEASVESIRKALAASSLRFTLERIGDHWTVSILLHAFLGLKNFDDFHGALGLSRQTLNMRLKALVELQVFERVAYQNNPPRYDYKLSKIGLDLFQVVLLSWAWERRWGPPSDKLPPALMHTACDHKLIPLLACNHCHEEVHTGNVRPEIDASKVDEAWPVERSKRSAGRGVAHGAEVDESGLYLLGIVADRSTILVIAAILLGCHRFDEMQGALGLGSKILSDRLKTLCTTGLLSKVADGNDARRFVYTLAPAARDLFGYVVTLSQWGERHLMPRPGAIRLIHDACGHRLAPPVLVCKHCRHVVLGHDVAMLWKPGRKGS